MADVFFSYTRSERDRLQPIVDHMISLGLKVWFDASIEVGSSYEEVIALELEKAKAIVVCWSEKSTKSKWVRSEAAFAQDQGTIVPCFLEPCVLKPPFNMTQTEDLSSWKGERGSPGWRKLIGRIAILVERPGLVDLMDCLPDRTGDNLGSWINRNPNDPFLPDARSIWARRQTERFAIATSSAAARLEEQLRRHQAMVRAKFASLSEDVENWLKTEGTTPTTRPDPDRVVSALLNLPIESNPAQPGEALQIATDNVENEKRISQTLRSENRQLQAQILQMQVDRKNEAQPQGRSYTLKLNALAAVFFTALLVGAGSTAAYWTTRTGNKSEAMAALRSEFERTKASDAQLIVSLRDENAALVADNHRAADARDAVLADLAKARAETDRVKAEAAKSLRRPSFMAITNSAAADFCSKNAGGLFDRDNTAQQGIADIDTLDDDTLQKTISSCSSAVSLASNDKTRRRLTAQLGRARMTSAIRRKMEQNDSEGSQSEMKLALKELEDAEQQGSIYAKVLLALFLDGYPGNQVGDVSFFGAPDRSRAVGLYTQAGDADNPIAMTNLAILKLDKKYPRDFDASKIETLLIRAEDLQYPRAFETHANAWLDPRMHPGTSDTERRKNAASLLAQEECLNSKSEVDKYFVKAVLLVPYRIKPVCSDLAQAH